MAEINVKEIMQGNEVERPEPTMDDKYLRYLLDTKGISFARLADEMDWSQPTCYRKRYGHTEWLISEVRKLSEMGFTTDEIRRIFF